MCFKPPAGQPFADMQTEIEQLLSSRRRGRRERHSTERRPARGQSDTTSPIRTGTAGSSSRDRGSTILSRGSMSSTPRSRTPDGRRSCSARCSASATRDDADPADATVADGSGPSSVYLVYLAKRGTFYPFAPTGHEQRDTELELRLRSTIGSDLPTEPDLSRWFPLWELPVA